MPIQRLSQLVDRVKTLPCTKVAAAYAQDSHTLSAICRARDEGFAEPIVVGDRAKILSVCAEAGLSPDGLQIVDIPDPVQASREAVRLVREDEADVLMKGSTSTDVYLRAILDKKTGLLPEGRIMSHVCIVEVPAYPKLMFLSDVAVIPHPTLEQKMQMIKYSVAVARSFGIDVPRVALLSAMEKPTPKLPDSMEAAILTKQCDRNIMGDVVIDGPVDLFLACDKESVRIKNIASPLDGEADIFIFPDIEASNLFYKGLMLFAQGELAALIRGTIKPALVTSRSESVMSKLYSMAFGCLMAHSEKE